MPDRPVTTSPIGVFLRWSRATLLTVVAMGSGVLAHVAAAGRMPGPVALGVLFATCLLITAGFVGRPASTLRVVSLVVGGQTLVHLSLTALAGHRGDPPLRRVATVTPALPAPATGRQGSYFDLAYAPAHPAGSAQLAVPAPVQHLLADLSGPHAVMAVAHLIAAGIVGLWLASGERALWGLLSLLGDTARLAVCGAAGSYAAATRLAVLIAGLARGAGEQLRRAGGHDRHRVPRPAGLLARVVVRRGPPLLLAA